MGEQVVRRAIYAGTFDPITVGHLDIIKRSSRLFDEIIVAVAHSQSKKPRFNLSQRNAMVNASIASLTNVTVVSFEGLLIDLTKELNAPILIRGVRNGIDFDYEMSMGHANASLCATLETIYLTPTLEYSFISSSVVRSILPFSLDVAHLMPPAAYTLLTEYLN
jgi:pantetheine-phosphate adenylyltransferase